MPVGVILQRLADLGYSYSYKGTLKIMEPEQQTTFGTTGKIFTDRQGIIVAGRFVAYHFNVQTNSQLICKIRRRKKHLA